MALERERQLRRRVMPWPSSLTRISAAPPSRRSTVTVRAPASSAFSTSSFTAEAGRSTTSPAAILLTSASGSRRMRSRRSRCARGPASDGCCCHFASRFSASIGVRWARSRLASSSRQRVGRRQRTGRAARRRRRRSSPAPAPRSAASSALARAITRDRQPGQPRHLDAVASGRCHPAAPCAGTRSRRSTRAPPRGSSARRRAAPASWVSSWKWVAKSTLGRAARSCSSSTTAHAMASPSNVEVPRPDLVEQHQAARREVVEDRRRLHHLDQERRLAAREVVLRAHAREDAVDQADARRARGHERAHLGEHDEVAGLAEVDRLAGHVRAGEDHDARLVVERQVVGRHRLPGARLQHRMAALRRCRAPRRRPRRGRTWPRSVGDLGQRRRRRRAWPARARWPAGRPARAATRPRTSSNSSYSSRRRRSSAPSTLASYSLSSGVT